MRPRLPIVIVAEGLELPEGALKSVDTHVTRSDGPHFLLEAVQTVLQEKDGQHFEILAESAAPLEQTLTNPSKYRIILVDDDTSVRERVALSLIAAGFDVVAAEEGFRALSQLRNKLSDVVVSDLEMPGMSGFELLSVIRRRFPQISTVGMSGSYTGDELPFGVIADASSPKVVNSRICFGSFNSCFLLLQPEAVITAESAPPHGFRAMLTTPRQCPTSC